MSPEGLYLNQLKVENHHTVTRPYPGNRRSVNSDGGSEGYGWHKFISHNQFLDDVNSTWGMTDSTFELQPKPPNMQAIAYMHTVDSCDSIVVYSPASSPTPYISIVLQRLNFLQQLRLLMSQVFFLNPSCKDNLGKLCWYLVLIGLWRHLDPATGVLDPICLRLPEEWRREGRSEERLLGAYKRSCAWALHSKSQLALCFLQHTIT